MSAGIQSQLLQQVPVYANAAQLASDQFNFVVGQMAIIETPSPVQVICVQQAPVNGQYVTTSTGLDGTVRYWLYFQSPDLVGGQSLPFTVRAVALSIAAYTGSGTGTLTASANGALGSIDGISTMKVGDQIFLQSGLTNLTAVDEGPWVIVSLGGASAKWVLSRPYWFLTGNTFVSGTQIKAGCEGAFFGGAVFRATAAAAVIDTTAPAFYIERFVWQRKLVAGTLVLAGGQPSATTTSATMPVGIYSATKSMLSASLAIANGTVTSTASYGFGNASSTVLCTAGAIGTAASTIFALTSAQATATGDTSTLSCLLVNF